MLDLLTGADAGRMLQSALTGLPNGTLDDFGHRIDRVFSRPGAESTVIYRVWYRVGDQRVDDQLVATDAQVDTGVRLSLGDTSIAVWRHPADPALPRLAAACDPGPPTGVTGTPILRSELLVYRPLRRAVVEVVTGSSENPRTTYLKVLRPEAFADVHRRHKLFADAGIGPTILHSDPEGLLVLERAPGEKLSELLSAAQRGLGGPPPGPKALISALDRLPEDVVELPAHPSWTSRTRFHARLASQSLPDLAPEIDLLADRIMHYAETYPTGDVVATHGDCYEANLFFDGARATFIDLDTAGPGHRVDDLACTLAHLAVLPQLSSFHYPQGNEVLAHWYAEFVKHVHPGALAVRVAAVLLSLVGTTGRDAALHRLDLVRSWLLRAAIP